MYNLSNEMLWDVAANLVEEAKTHRFTERLVLEVLGSHCLIDDEYIDTWIDNLGPEEKAVLLYRVKVAFQDYVLETLHHAWHNILDKYSED